MMMRIFALLLLVCVLSTSLPGQFQNYYGTSLNNSFSRVIQHGANYYVLGSKEISPGVIRATITYLDAAGNVSWVKDLDVSAQWNDGVLTPTGDLMVVGHTYRSTAPIKV